MLSEAAERTQGWVCPFCLSDLEANQRSLTCTVCRKDYPVTASGQPDFRPKTPCEFTLRYSYDPAWARFSWERVRVGWPEKALEFPTTEDWESTEYSMMQSIPKAPDGGRSLDLGCGIARQRFKEPLSLLGYHHTGIDIDGNAPDALADAHLLPFSDESFDLVVTSAAFEHVKNPHVAMTEAARVTKQGALFVGSIAFNEPFHISYFHQSPLGVYELLVSSGFDCCSIILSNTWNVFSAHLEMGFAGIHYPRMLRELIVGTLYRGSLLPAKVKSLLRRNSSILRTAELSFARSHTASVGFVAVRTVCAHENRMLRGFRQIDSSRVSTEVGLT